MDYLVVRKCAGQSVMRLFYAVLLSFFFFVPIVFFLQLWVISSTMSDPVADFLAREQDVLAEIDDNLLSNANNGPLNNG